MQLVTVCVQTQGLKTEGDTGEAKECAICLAPFSRGDQLRRFIQLNGNKMFKVICIQTDYSEVL